MFLPRKCYCIISYTSIYALCTVRSINRDKSSILNKLLSTLSKNEIENLYSKKITGFSTWYKYRSIYHPNVALKKLKEDCCDTCFKYEIALEDTNISESDKVLIRAALSVSPISNK